MTDNMFTQCPTCKTAYRITTDEIRAGQGKVLCSKCNTGFDAISSLADVAFENHFSDIRRIPTLSIERSIPPKLEDDAFWSEIELPANTSTDRTGWGLRIGTLAMAMLLITQIVTYQTPLWAQNRDIRPWLEKFCAKIDCRLPKYRHPEDIEVIERALEPAGHDALMLHLVIINNGTLPVALPEMSLNLIRFNGEPLAQRIFTPSEYFDDADSMSELQVGKPITLSLKIVNPNNEIAGYSFKFI